MMDHWEAVVEIELAVEVVVGIDLEAEEAVGIVVGEEEVQIVAAAVASLDHSQ